MKEPQNKSIVDLFKVLGHPSSYEILKILVTEKESYCVNEISKKIGITPSAVSHQMSKLEKLSLVNPNRNGQMICYTLSKSKEANILRNILNII